jgi:gliding motility-associated-like protein
MALLISAWQAHAQVSMPDTVCIGAARMYSVNTPATPSTYSWRIDGVLQSSVNNKLNITWNTAGLFTITVQERSNITGCYGDIRSGTVLVLPVPVANAGPDVTTCFGKDVQLNGSGGLNYTWSPGNYLSSLSVANPQVIQAPPGTHIYTLSVSNGGCVSPKRDTVIVKITNPPKVFAGNDTLIAVNQLLQLNAQDITNAGFISYSWSPRSFLNNVNIADPVFSMRTTTSNAGIVYTVTALTSDNCIASDNIIIKVFEKPDLFVPSAFTPNNDRLNDFAVVVPVGIKDLKYFRIFNRWGINVFSTADYTKGWDGVFKGQPQPSSVFVFEAMGVDYNGNNIFKKGTITLIR